MPQLLHNIAVSAHMLKGGWHVVIVVEGLKKRDICLKESQCRLKLPQLHNTVMWATMSKLSVTSNCVHSFVVLLQRGALALLATKAKS